MRDPIDDLNLSPEKKYDRKARLNQKKIALETSLTKEQKKFLSKGKKK
jgi:hypothetical protein